MFESMFEVVPSVDYVAKNSKICWSKNIYDNAKIFKTLEEEFQKSIIKSIVKMSFKGWQLYHIFHEKDQTQILFRRGLNGS